MEINYLLILFDGFQNIEYAFKPGNTVKIGRAKGECDIVLNQQLISRQHLQVHFEKNGVLIKDLGSKNGTFLVDEILIPHHDYEIKKDTRIFLGPGKQFYVDIKTPKDGDVTIFGEMLEKPSKNELTGQGVKALLKNKATVLVGRKENCDIILADQAVSRNHARFFIKNDRYYVEDLQSSNGTFLNGRRIHGEKEFKEKDTVFIGLHAFSLEESATEFHKEYAISAHQISKVYPNGYVGLQPTQLQVPYKEMIALMGPSGCGKSTLLKALNGDSPPSHGVIKIFGLDMSEHFGMLKHVIGYVPQEDIVHKDLTVYQSLYYAAKLRLSESATEEQIQGRIDEVLNSLKINTPDIRKSRVVRLSGGQKKRISIAVELLNKPKILFLDEPTSPLDPETIEDFLLCLKALCKEGTTVIMVTHKPDDLNYVDRVVFMGVNGYLSYDGNRDKLLLHYEKENLIQIYTLLSKKDASQAWYEKWHEGGGLKLEPTKETDFKKPKINTFNQMYWLSKRYFSIKTGNMKNLVIMIAQPVFIAFLIMVAFSDLFITQESSLKQYLRVIVPNVGILFLLTLASIWFGVSNSAKEIVGEKDILKREYFFNLKLAPYLISKQFVLLLISAIQIFILLGLLFLKFPELTDLFQTYAMLMLISFCSIQFGLLLSTFTSTTEEVMSILPIALMPQIILAGIIQPLESKLTILLSYLTIGRWGTEGIARIQDKVLTGNQTSFMEKTLNNNLYPAGKTLLETASLNANVFFLLLLYVVMTAGIVILLYKKLNSKS